VPAFGTRPWRDTSGPGPQLTPNRPPEPDPQLLPIPRDAFFEGNPFIGRTLQTHPDLRGLKRLGVFLSPLSREEILFLRDEAHVSLPDLVAEVMRRKLLRRAHRQKTDLSLKDLEEIERRAGSAYRELKEARGYWAERDRFPSDSRWRTSRRVPARGLPA